MAMMCSHTAGGYRLGDHGKKYQKRLKSRDNAGQQQMGRKAVGQTDPLGTLAAPIGTAAGVACPIALAAGC
jgi:hypothetical protein